MSEQLTSEQNDTVVALCKAVKEMLHHVDLDHDIHAAVTSLTIVADGPGDFRIVVKSPHELHPDHYYQNQIEDNKYDE